MPLMRKEIKKVEFMNKLENEEDGIITLEEETGKLVSKMKEFRDTLNQDERKEYDGNNYLLLFHIFYLISNLCCIPSYQF